MGHFLTFAMVAPMASFGAIAVGERRDGWDRPARSAVLGLIAASLGLTRDDQAGHAALSRDYGLALLCHAPGRLLTDYHTAQAAPSRRNWCPATRAEELAGSTNTILSRRDYRTGTWHLGAIWLRPDTPDDTGWTLDALREAMKRPVFTLSIGRRSCPPGLPLAPQIIDAASATDALMERHEHGPEAKLRVRRSLFREQLSAPGRENALMIVMDAADVAAQKGAFSLMRRELRRDEPLSRTRWQFGLREEAILRPPMESRMVQQRSSPDAAV